MAFRFTIESPAEDAPNGTPKRARLRLDRHGNVDLEVADPDGEWEMMLWWSVETGQIHRPTNRVLEGLPKDEQGRIDIAK